MMLLRPVENSFRRKGIPLVFDPLISAFDKVVFERQKFSAARRRRRCCAGSKSALLEPIGLSLIPKSMRLISREHAHPIERICGCGGRRRASFKPQAKTVNQIPEALFFGTFIGLQGATYIAEAVAHYQGPVCRLTFWALA